MTHRRTFCAVARAERVSRRTGSAASPTLRTAIPIATEITISCSTLNDSPIVPSSCGAAWSPKMLPGTRPVRKSHQPPVVPMSWAAEASTELFRPGLVSRPSPMPMETAISAVMANQSRVWPASRAALDTCLRLAMLTMTAVTISGGTRTFSSVTKVLPTVWRVLVSQLGVPSATGPISRARSPRATPSTRARRTCAANGTRRRRASTEGEPFGGTERGRRTRPASTAGGRHPSEVQGTPPREAPQVLHRKMNADGRWSQSPMWACSHGREDPPGRATGEVAVRQRDHPMRRHREGAVDRRVLEVDGEARGVLRVDRRYERRDRTGVDDPGHRAVEHHGIAGVVRGHRAAGVGGQVAGLARAQAAGEPQPVVQPDAPHRHDMGCAVRPDGGAPVVVRLPKAAFDLRPVHQSAALVGGQESVA